MSMYKKYVPRRLITLFLTLLLLAVAAFPAFALDEEAICADLGADWWAFAYHCSYNYFGTNPVGDDFSYTVRIPTRIMYNSFIQDELQTFINVSINTYMSTVETASESAVGAQYTFEIEPEIFHHNADIFSVVFFSYDYLGGAHPNQIATSYTFNRATNQVLGFSDLFIAGSDPLAIIAPMAEAQIIARLGDDEFIRSGIEIGAGTNIDNYSVFALTEDALLIFFQPYQVAPYAAGGQVVRVPLSDIAHILNIGS